MQIITTIATVLFAWTSTAAAAKPRVNGWYPCAFSSNNHHNGTNSTMFECAEVELPLCYDNVCTSDRQIDVFIKRRLGHQQPAVKKALIMLAGGPGSATVGLEARIEDLIKVVGESVDFYLLDHRGTGRSEYLNCDAAQALTTGSPGGKRLSDEELQACIADLTFKYKGQAAGFSTTSVAMDVRTMINLFMADQDVYVAGVSYGTFVVQRVVQLNIPQVKGYIFNGADTLSLKNDPIETSNSHWNEAMVAPARRLLEYCYDDKGCHVQFQSRETVVEDTLTFMDKLDQETETNPCAQVFVAAGYDRPSVALRTWLFRQVKSLYTRSDGLNNLASIQRCNGVHLKKLETLFHKDKVIRSDGPDELNDANSLLYNVVVFSERWAQPAPTRKERNQFFFNSPFATDDEVIARQYCIFTGSTEPACEELQAELPKNLTGTFFYKRDKYFTMPLQLTNHASALILNGGLDFATPKEFGDLLYRKLQGTGKGVMLVNFDYGMHCKGEAVKEQIEPTCMYSLFGGFLQHDGDITKINTTCMKNLPGTIFH